MSVNTLPSIQYSLDVIQEEARQLVHKVVSRQQPIYMPSLVSGFVSNMS